MTEAIDTDSAAGRLMGHILGALAEFERALIVERTQAGLKAAKQRGQKLGRKPSLSEDQRKHARELLAKGESPPAVARLLNVCRATLIQQLENLTCSPAGQSEFSKHVPALQPLTVVCGWQRSSFRIRAASQ